MAFFRMIFSIPKSIYFNFRVLNFSKAIKLPFFVDFKVKLGKLRKVVELPNKTKIFDIKIGVGGSKNISSFKSFFSIENSDSKVIMNGKAHFSEGVSIIVNGGTLIFGMNFYSNKNLNISCDSNISFGNDVMIGYNVNFRDSDGHYVLVNSIEKESKGQIIIGNHVWICPYVDVLKNVIVNDESIIAYKSLVINSSFDSNTLICGQPAVDKIKNISWKK